jgi:hypothetical protein
MKNPDDHQKTDVLARIVPLNLPAAFQSEILGNPASSRLESTVANCMPGLEIDHKNLDRRFFPGLVFEISLNLGMQLVDVDPDEAGLPEELRARLVQLKEQLKSEPPIYLAALEQTKPDSTKIRIELWNPNQTGSIVPLDDSVVWRLIRSLDSGPVTIAFALRGAHGLSPLLELSGPRRVYQNPDGTLSDVYQPGELGQSLCSPWQHDFRDCSCNFWAANHPDIAFPEEPDSIAGLQSPGRVADEAGLPVMWLRKDREDPVRPRLTSEECRPLEMDPYEINHRWQELAFVLEGREIASVYSPGPIQFAVPLPVDQLKLELERLATMEHALAIEYLYARYSVAFDGTTRTQVGKYAEFIAHELLMIAVSEMTHIRWVNQLMWQLWHDRKILDFKPSLGISATVPGAPPGVDPESEPFRPVDREVVCRPLNDAIDGFLAAERPSGTLEGKYAHIFSTLRTGYSPDLGELVSRIIADGVSHYSRFRNVQAILKHYNVSGSKPEPFIRRPFELIQSPDFTHGILRDALNIYRDLLLDLFMGYETGDAASRSFISKARISMDKMDEIGRSLAKNGQGLPLLELGRMAVKSLP